MDRRLTRRNTLAIVGIATTAGLAGCGDVSSDEVDDSEDNGDDRPENGGDESGVANGDDTDNGTGETERDGGILLIGVGQTHTLVSGSDNRYDGVEIHNEGSLCFERGAAVTLNSEL